MGVTGSRRTAVVVLLLAVPLVALAAALSLGGEESEGRQWRLLEEETFDRRLPVDAAAWTRDSHGVNSPWHVDGLDDDGEVWDVISGPAFDQALGTFDVYRKRVRFGHKGWLTAEIAAQDKDKDGSPDSDPTLRRTMLNGESAALIDEPSWDAGVLIRPTHVLPARYRVEVTLRRIDFGGERDGDLRYDGKFNGYRQRPCVTGYPWTFQGAVPGQSRCESPDVTNQNGFYYLTILDYATPAPHGNPGIHNHRKVVLDGYNSVAPWSRRYGVCDPASKRIVSVKKGNLNDINAVFIRGDRFRKGNNNISNEYYYKTECGDFSGDSTWGPRGRLHDILSAAELQPESMPSTSYTFAVERGKESYTVELTGPFRGNARTTLRYTHKFVEDGRPVWHYNQGQASTTDGSTAR